MSAPDPAIIKPIPGGVDAGCGSCAFRAGSETRSDIVTQVKGELCVLGGVPFYCHYDRQGVDFHDSDRKPAHGELVICQGWAHRVRVASKDPRWRKNRGLRKTYAEMGLGAVNLLTGSESDIVRKQALKTVGAMIDALVLPAKGEQAPDA